MSSNSPLEHLAAFVIAMGVVSTIAISIYGKRMARAGAEYQKPATS